MAVSKEERNRILRLVEAGQVSAVEAGDLLDALASEPERSQPSARERILRLRTTNLKSGSRKANITATIPVALVKTSLRLGVHLFPQLNRSALEDVLRTVERGAAGRLLDIQDMEKGERLEIFVE